MKTEQAIKLLHRLQDEQFDGIHGDERREALSMAVRALEGDGDTISRQAAMEALNKLDVSDGVGISSIACSLREEAIRSIENLPSAQPERDTPIKPKETTDTAWGIPARQAVCPKCDYYLGHVAFLGDYKGKRITYCETCGQAIDWEGWDFDE